MTTTSPDAFAASDRALANHSSGAPTAADPRLPEPRGPLTAHLVEHLLRPTHPLAPLPPALDDPLDGDDSALALHILYELHYRGFAGVDEAWEWEPTLLAARRDLETALEARLREVVEVPASGLAPSAVRDGLLELAEDGDGPSLSGFVARKGTLDHVRELMVHRSAYQLKEADPHTWGIPRLRGVAKAAMVEIQRGEYGDGRPADVHATIFAEAMAELGLDSTYGAYIDRLPGITLSTGNLISLLGLHRRWRGALVGHLALFEMCSVRPMSRYLEALERLGHGHGPAARFYRVHVEADAHHSVVALDDMVGGLLRDDPSLGADVIFGALALTAVEGRFSAHVQEAWAAGLSSLRPADAPVQELDPVAA